MHLIIENAFALLLLILMSCNFPCWRGYLSATQFVDVDLIPCQDLMYLNKTSQVFVLLFYFKA